MSILGINHLSVKHFKRKYNENIWYAIDGAFSFCKLHYGLECVYEILSITNESIIMLTMLVLNIEKIL